MGGTSIDNQENRAFGAGDEALEKFNEDIGVDTALLLDHEPHLASRGDRRDEAHAMACAGGFDDRRFALLAPTPPRVIIRAHVGGIAKEDLRFFPLCKGFDLRVLLLEPLLDQGLVALLRAVQRLLASDAELRQQSTNRIGAQRDNADYHYKLPRIGADCPDGPGWPIFAAIAVPPVFGEGRVLLLPTGPRTAPGRAL